MVRITDKPIKGMSRETEGTRDGGTNQNREKYGRWSGQWQWPPAIKVHQVVPVVLPSMELAQADCT